MKPAERGGRFVGKSQVSDFGEQLRDKAQRGISAKVAKDLLKFRVSLGDETNSDEIRKCR